MTPARFDPAVYLVRCEECGKRSGWLTRDEAKALVARHNRKHHRRERRPFLAWLLGDDVYLVTMVATLWVAAWVAGLEV